MSRSADGARRRTEHSRRRPVKRRGPELRVASRVVINEQRKTARGRIHARDVPSAKNLVRKAARRPALSLAERQIISYEHVESVTPVEQGRSVGPADVERIGDRASIFLRETEIVEGMSEGIVHAKCQTMRRSFPQADETSMVIGKALICIPIDSRD